MDCFFHYLSFREAIKVFMDILPFFKGEVKTRNYTSFNNNIKNQMMRLIIII